MTRGQGRTRSQRSPHGSMCPLSDLLQPDSAIARILSRMKFFPRDCVSHCSLQFPFATFGRHPDNPSAFTLLALAFHLYDRLTVRSPFRGLAPDSLDEPIARQGFADKNSSPRNAVEASNRIDRDLDLPAASFAFHPATLATQRVLS